MNEKGDAKHPLVEIISNKSDHDHSIAIAEEPVLILNGFLVGFHRQVITSKGANHNQEACFR